MLTEYKNFLEDNKTLLPKSALVGLPTEIPKDKTDKWEFPLPQYLTERWENIVGKQMTIKVF